MILVSGGTGLVGSHLLVKLVKKGERVRAIYRSEASKTKCKKVFAFHRAKELYPQVEWVKADLKDLFSLEKCFENVTHVYHAGAMVSFDESLEKELLEVNIDGTKNMVNLSLEKGIKKLIYISSVATLGKLRNQNCINEAAGLQIEKSTSTYAISKYYAENEVWRGSAEGLKIGIINPSTILGYGNWDESSLVIIKKVARGLRFYTGGANGFVGVDDVVNAAIQLMESKLINERFLISSENLKFKEVFELIAKEFNQRAPDILVGKQLAELFVIIDRLRSFLFGLPRLLPASNLNSIFRERCFSSVKFKQAFGYQFQPIEKVVQELAPAFQNENL